MARAGTTRIAILDLGSTSFHLLVAEATQAGIRRLLRERVMMRLGALIEAKNGFSARTIATAVEEARELAVVARKAGASLILPVATSAVRDARNGPELADRIAKAIKEPVRILSGEEEARLIFEAFRHRLELRGCVLGVDLGGGSLELVLGDEHHVRWEATLPLGVVRLHREFVGDDPMPAKAARRIRRHVRRRLGEDAKVASGEAAVVVAAGGTLRALARLLQPGGSINGLAISFDALEELCEELVASRHGERLRMPGIQRRRADLLPTGALVLVGLAEKLGLDGYTVCDWGLREGVLLDYLAQGRRL